jgi:PAS domain S-box-containing protein
MRDQHRPKQDLINEVVALRKQVADLRDAMASRQRVEDALRHSEEQLRALTDGSPVGLCMLLPSGGPLAVNRPFARMLGYDSPGELLTVGNVLGVFATREEQARLTEMGAREEEFTARVLFRRKNGVAHTSWVIGAGRPEPAAIALAVVQEISAAWSGGKRSA